MFKMFKNFQLSLFVNQTIAKQKILLYKLFLKLLFSIIFSFLMWVSAESFFYLPFTPVPITMQVFTVLLSAILLGKNWAFFSQCFYISMGFYGLPVFAGFKNAYTAIPGPTGGYIIGFLLSAYITGMLFEKSKNNKNFNLNLNNQPSYKLNQINKTDFLKNEKIYLFFCCFAGLMVIYITGYLHLFLYFYNSGKFFDIIDLLIKTFKLGVYPFIIFDLIKILFITSIYKTLKLRY